MSRIATMGTSSCGTFALSGFKDGDYELEQQYMEASKDKKLDMDDEAYEDIKSWYTNTLYPVHQPLGKSGEHSFSALMNAVKKHERLNEKFLVVTLISYQLNILGEGYWNKALKEWDFKFFHTTANSTMDGDLNYLFYRDLAEVDKKPSGW